VLFCASISFSIEASIYFFIMLIFLLLLLSKYRKTMFGQMGVHILISYQYTNIFYSRTPFDIIMFGSIVVKNGLQFSRKNVPLYIDKCMFHSKMTFHCW
jgi:hypothetical protein